MVANTMGNAEQQKWWFTIYSQFIQFVVVRGFPEETEQMATVFGEGNQRTVTTFLCQVDEVESDRTRDSMVVSK